MNYFKDWQAVIVGGTVSEFGKARWETVGLSKENYQHDDRDEHTCSALEMKNMKRENPQPGVIASKSSSLPFQSLTDMAFLLLRGSPLG